MLQPEFRKVTNVISYEGSTAPKVVIISGCPSWDGTPLSGTAKAMVTDSARKAGFTSMDLGFMSILDVIPPGRKEYALGAQV